MGRKCCFNMDGVSDGLYHFLASENNIKSQITEAECNPVSTKYSVCYVVAAIICKDDCVLMIRESKRSCYGQWYLPAGRMEQDESMEDAVKREVKEESCMEIDVWSILCVESQKCWFRFSFVGECVGGKMKDPSQEDEHSIEAKWIPVADVLHYTASRLDLRETDILPLVSQAVSWYRTKRPIRESFLLPVSRAHSLCLLRIILFAKLNDRFFIFVGPSPSFIECIANKERKRLGKLVQSTLQVNGFDGPCVLHGLLSIEHTGNSSATEDGFLITVLAESQSQTMPSNSQWIILQDESLIKRIRSLSENSLCPPVS